MARQGVFSRDDDTPESIPRSLQLLSHRKVMTCKYMEIYPNFCEVLNPNESIKLNVTNFLRSIPMVTPQLSRVRLVQRFYAVPFRIMWQPWENWIKGEDDAAFQYDLPYVVNACTYESKSDWGKHPFYNAGFSPEYEMTSEKARAAAPMVSRFIALNNKGLVGPVIKASSKSGQGHFWFSLFGTRELGDYFGYPKYTRLSKIQDGSNKWLVPHAFKMCAYQLCYSYGYRKPNVQDRVDDFFELSVNQLANGHFNLTSTTATVPDSYKNPQSDEYPSVFAGYNSYEAKIVKPVYRFHSILTTNSSGAFVDTLKNNAVSSEAESINATSWDKVEHFPLRAGPNASLCSTYVDELGDEVRTPSNIALFRMRYANWQDDYFTTSNPWQQRGDEAQIPVSVSGNGSYFNVLPHDNVSDVVGKGSYFFWKSSIDGTMATYSNPTAMWNTSAQADSINAVRLVVRQSDVAGSFEATVSPSAFRFAMALQHIKELQAQTDNRYKSYMRKIFGATIQDNRIDRPEFLGGSIQEINVTDVVQTSQSGDTVKDSLGSLAGRGTSAKTSKTISFYAHEHTVVIGLVHIIPDTVYSNGLAREDNVHDRFDFIMPQFSRLSEQPVYNYELGVKDWTLSPTANHTVFGYEPIYNYERWRKSLAVADFTDFVNEGGSRDWYKPWLVTRDFGFAVHNVVSSTTQEIPILDANQPTLSDKFLSGRYGCDYSNFVVNDPRRMYPFILDSYFNLRWTRIIPTRGIPAKLG